MPWQVYCLAPIEMTDEEIILKICKLGTPSYIEDMHEIYTCFIAEENYFQNWYFDIYNYLKHKPILDEYDKNEKVRLKRTAIKYAIIGEVLYRRSFDGALLRCLK